MNKILEDAFTPEQKEAFHRLTSENNRKLVHGSLFSGIGGFDLAAQWMGWENAFHCEWNPFGQRILKYYWPEAVSYGDITKTDFTIWRGRIDILTGGFPCQPYSTAGKRKGTEDERHLWPEYLRAIREIRPRYVVGENVSGLVNWSGGMVFEQVQIDLENEGYEVFPFIIPAAGVNAPHRRDRIWFIARIISDSNSNTERSPRPGRIPSENGSKKHEFPSSRRTSPKFDSGRSNVSRTDTDTNCKRRGEKGQGFTTGKRSKRIKRISIQWASSNAHNYGCERKSWRGRTRSKWRILQGELKKRGKPFRSSKTIANAGGIRFSISWEAWRRRPGFKNICSIIAGNDANANRARREKSNTAYFSNRQGQRSWGDPSEWANWPTRSPICNGNDGISSGLVPVTVSGRKGRRTLSDSQAFNRVQNESIKAGGNAIVPEVAHMIFKAINEFEKLCE